MSKAFTKEDDGSTGEDLPDLPQSRHPNYVTREGLDELEERLRDRRSELSGLRAVDDDTKDRYAIAVAERDIRFLEARVGSAMLVDLDELDPAVVAFGAEVDVLDDDGEPSTYRIVGEDQADPKRGLIAPFSPLAVALRGARVDDEVEWKRPSGKLNLEVVAIRYPGRTDGASSGS